VLEEDDSETKYEKFVQANRQAMEECVPRRSKKNAIPISTDQRVAETRRVAGVAHHIWDTDNSEENKEAWRLALNDLYLVYEQVQEQALEEQIRNIESAHGDQKYGEAWRTVNEITGRKRAREGQVSGKSPEERKTTWFSHFRNLLGNPPDVDDSEEDVPSIFGNLDI